MSEWIFSCKVEELPVLFFLYVAWTFLFRMHTNDKFIWTLHVRVTRTWWRLRAVHHRPCQWSRRYRVHGFQHRLRSRWSACGWCPIFYCFSTRNFIPSLPVDNVWTVTTLCKILILSKLIFLSNQISNQFKFIWDTSCNTNKQTTCIVK